MHMNHKFSKADILAVISESISLISSLSNDCDHDPLDTYYGYLYAPDSRLNATMSKLFRLMDKTNPSKAEQLECGRLLERLAGLAFAGLEGATSFKSFRAPSAQYDLLVTGDSIHWDHICRLLYSQGTPGTIVVEAKAISERVSDQVFSRLCNVLDHKLFNTCFMGVLMTINGAAGFPRVGDESRRSKLSEVRLSQAMYFAKSRKPVVVLERTDYDELLKPGGLIRLLRRKIRDAEELSGLPITACDDILETDLPPHLADVNKRRRKRC